MSRATRIYMTNSVIAWVDSSSAVPSSMDMGEIVPDTTRLDQGHLGYLRQLWRRSPEGTQQYRGRTPAPHPYACVVCYIHLPQIDKVLMLRTTCVKG